MLRAAAAVVSFVVAFLIGMVPAYLIAGAAPAREPLSGPGSVEVSYHLRPLREAAIENIRAEDIVGVWAGEWGHQSHPCIIEIDRVDGTRFRGTLRDSGAVVSIEGYIDPESRRVHFNETRVVKLGPGMSEWSLGINTGTFSPDGRTLAGFGTDRWGSYQWEVSLEPH